MLSTLFNLYKKSYVVIINYFVIYIGTFLINIFVNKFDIDTINYFYGVMILLNFIQQIEVALADAASIFTLRVTTSKNKTAIYLKNVFLCLIIFMTSAFAFIFLFRDFIFKELLQTIVVDDYRFLTIMIFAFLISIPTLYFQDFLKFNDRYKDYLKTTTLFNSILILSYLIFSILTHSLNNIAYANIIASIFTIFYTFYLISTNKGIIKFDTIYLFTRKVKDFSHTFITSLKIFVQYLFYYIGTFLKTLILIGISSKLFNAHEYIVSAFFIFEGIFEGIITTINIKITKKLNNENKKDAYDYAKKGLFALLINQTIISGIYLVLRNFILSFINTELLIVAKEIDLFLLLFINLSILDWAFSYNILLRGKKVTLQMILELFTALGYIVLLIIIKTNMNNNVYFALSFINGLILFKIIVNIFYFKTRKWMNIEEKSLT